MRLKYRLGWLPDVPDQRDIPFTAVFRIPRKLPASVNLRAGCSTVEQQGNLGSCTAQALVGALEFLELSALTQDSPFAKPLRRDKSPGRDATPRQGGLPDRFRDLSRLFVYYNERLAMGTVLEDSGAMLRTGIKVLKARGVCREALWPYNIRLFTVKPLPPCYAEAARHQVTTYQRLNTLNEMKACLAMGLPFVFGFAVYEHVMSAAVERTGKIRLPRPGERMVGGHAVMAVGYRDRTRSLLFRNSWGADWGQSGYGEIPYAYLESRNLSDDFWCIQGTESDLYAAWRLKLGQNRMC
ncbi:MAG: C1 family peptidase [Verrucomicrobia bacterium]|nr:C1 family peptidase [Verrucomicrobiota bacterium]MCG2679036.1 C1 family peptidase [Kiritimatiellia bacterium]MBU4247848.1 C1 family peptidase [Verrucomicrobiota bacterium]MBU4291657.1 C1 family peptidase [Verrucomicrobiota bacterium]MBU4427824.1 C1 family peptidase [Verrucomicrobiota bacterium]